MVERNDMGAAPRRWRRGGRFWLLVGAGVPALALLALLAWASFGGGGRPGGLAVNTESAEVQAERDLAADFELPLLSGGGVVRLAEQRGQVVLLDFWASWCTPCRDEAPALAAAYAEYRDRGVAFIGVNLWDNARDAAAFAAQHGQTYPSGLDAEGRAAISYGVRGIPEKFFIDRNGTIARKFVGPMDLPQLRAILDELLAQP